MTKKDYYQIIIAIILILLLGSLLLIDNNPSTEKEDRSETYYISGKGAGLFGHIMFNPYVISPLGEKQEIIAFMKNPELIEKFTITLEDEQEVHTKEVIGDNGFYKIEWEPKELIYSKYYPVIFKYETFNGDSDFIKLFWKSKNI